MRRRQPVDESGIPARLRVRRVDDWVSANEEPPASWPADRAGWWRRVEAYRRFYAARTAWAKAQGLPYWDVFGEERR
jgi:hypothetical protein